MRTLIWIVVALLLAMTACDDKKSDATGEASTAAASDGARQGGEANAAPRDGNAKANDPSVEVKTGDVDLKAKGKDEGEVKTGNMTAHGKGTEGTVKGGGVDAKGNMKGGKVKAGGVTVDTTGVTLPGGGKVQVP